ncbi:MAG: DUF86 domain-containing protein [Muribaculaceae bacterium]|nr:DUF86 domain-containing protein [Muribaculaceae bacterium]
MPHTLILFRDQYEDDEIIGNPITFFGFVKHLEIVGEAAYKLTKEFKESHPEIEWHTIEGMRHVMVHGYYSIEKNIVLSTLKEDVDALRDTICCLLNQ